MSQRTDRVDELLRQEIGALLAKEVADPRIGFATITEVETSPDLRHARVWVSVIGAERDRIETVRALQQAMGYVRHELGKRLRIRRIPELHVRLDDTAERGTRVLHVLQELEAGREPEPSAAVGESLPTPVPRLPHEGDATEEAAAEDVAPPIQPPRGGEHGAGSRPRRSPPAGRAGRGRRPGVDRGRRAGRQ